MSVIEQALERARHQAPPSASPMGETLEPQAAPLRPLSVPGNMADAPLSIPDISGGQHIPCGQREEYRLLKERILALRKKSDALSLIMITSPMRGEGKTHIACNLALSLAQEFDHTVLLIDADTRSPSCHQALGLPLSDGLSECLFNGKDFREVLVRTGMGSLTFLGMGKTTGQHAAELFASRRMGDLLAEIKNRYADRIIIMDTAPFLPFAETRLLSRMADGILVVARENVTLKSHLHSTLRAMRGCNLLGLVYNDAVNRGADREVFTLGSSY